MPKLTKPYDYRDFFQFSLGIPLAFEKGVPQTAIEEEMYSQFHIPLVYITDKENIIFKNTLKEFKKHNITIEVEVIVLSVYYKPNTYLS
jgi:hypothetical protein